GQEHQVAHTFFAQSLEDGARPGRRGRRLMTTRPLYRPLYWSAHGCAQGTCSCAIARVTGAWYETCPIRERHAESKLSPAVAGVVRPVRADRAGVAPWRASPAAVWRGHSLTSEKFIYPDQNIRARVWSWRN